MGYRTFHSLFRKKECCVPTGTGWFLILFFFLAVSFSFMSSIHSFLAPIKPVPADALIVEGWLPDYCFVAIVKKYHDKPVKVFVTGGPLESGSYLKEYGTYADLGAATLSELSYPDSLIIPVPSDLVNVDRTHASAVAFKNWIDSTGNPLKRFILYSHSTHTRRSALLFRKALGKGYKVGSIAIVNRNYDTSRWWTSSEGVRSVIDELVAYVYSLFFVNFTIRERLGFSVVLSGNMMT